MRWSMCTMTSDQQNPTSRRPDVGATYRKTVSDSVRFEASVFAKT